MLSGTEDPIIVGCDGNSNFRSIIREVFDAIEGRHPFITEEMKQKSISFSRFGIGGGYKEVSTKESSDPGSVNEAVRLTEFLVNSFGHELVIVIDEFDQIVNESDQRDFANFIKQVSDRHVQVKFIVCGIADSPEVLMKAHASADRYFHTVELGKLPWEARFEIVIDAARRLGVVLDESTVIRIARISDGFPHYVHFVSEKLFWSVFEARNDGRTDAVTFESAMNEASAAMDMKLRGPYEKATQKYSNDYEYVLWAAADGHELKRRSVDIYSSYLRVMNDIEQKPLERSKFNQRLNALKRENHACLLVGNRQGWYEFAEKMIRGYVRLRAEQSAVNLDVDHPTSINSSRWRQLEF